MVEMTKKQVKRRWIICMVLSAVYFSFSLIVGMGELSSVTEFVLLGVIIVIGTILGGWSFFAGSLCYKEMIKSLLTFRFVNFFVVYFKSLVKSITITVKVMKHD